MWHLLFLPSHMLHFVDKFWSATCRWLLFNEFTLRRQSLALVFAIRRVLHACEIELPADVENTRPLRLCQSPICHGTNQGSFYSVWYLSRSGNVTHYVIERLGQGNESAFFCKFLSCLQADVEAVFYPHAATRPDGWLIPLLAICHQKSKNPCYDSSSSVFFNMHRGRFSPNGPGE